MKNLTTIAAVVVVVFSFFIPAVKPSIFIPQEVEITLANDGLFPILYMCQTADRKDSLYELKSNSTFRFVFRHIAFPMRWCYIYTNPNSHGFFWAYTVRSRCTKCFWSINKYPSLYRTDKGRWERQKLFMPPGFNMSEYFIQKPDGPPIPTANP
ncbi:hypothetical protein BUALT_Bualt08G0064900 [Buddleja alternifolia]|uniref:S-protein homolog n=1 Tax=Buddleja alternifolia TaxID=168488 RepID=A0AAV6XFA3_9LAMI|nr:hypothetical protein BUALT_Bualt08G0064900 [Buddleja alternifolia]